MTIVNLTDSNLANLVAAIPQLNDVYFSFLNDIDPSVLLSDAYLCVLLLVDDGDIVGYGHLKHEKGRTVSLAMVIIATKRRRGLGSTLLTALIGRAWKNNVTKIRLNVFRENTPAIKLYEKSNFRLEGLFSQEEYGKDLLALALFRPTASHFVPWSRPAIGIAEHLGVEDVFNSDWFMEGPKTEGFENLVAKYVNAKHAIVVNSGTSALYAIYNTLLKPSDCVIVPAYTFISTVMALLLSGIPANRVLLADCEKDTGNIDARHVESLVQAHNVQAIIVVDVAGLPHNASKIKDIAKRYNLIVIEDAAEALGAEHQQEGPIGSFADATIFSFHTAKTITTIEGGAITTNNDAVAKRLRWFRRFGETDHFVHPHVGTNLKFTDMQAAIGIAQIEKLPNFIANRLQIANFYFENLGHIFDFGQIPAYASCHTYTMFMIILNSRRQRNSLASFLERKQIATRKGWAPIHKQEVFKNCWPNIHLPNSEALAERALYLPMFNDMKLTQAELVVSAAKEWNEKHRN